MPYYQNAGVEADSLIAHIVLKDSIDRDFLKIRKELIEFLPQYMVPNFFMAHTSLPQTSSGKIDRQYLSRLRVEDQSNQKEQPINYLEVHVSFLFQRIIKLKRMPSRKDDFFLLGGDSMGAVELQLELNNVINKEVPISDIISDSTVAGLASLLENLSRTTQEKKSPVLVQLSDKGSLSPLFLVHGRAGQAPISPHFIRLMGDEQPIYSFQAKGLNGIDAPAKSIKEMAEDYIREMKVVQPKGPYYLGAMCVGSYIAILMAQTLIKLGETIYPLLLIDPPAPPFAPPPESFQQKEFLDKFSISARDHVMLSAKEGKYNVDLKNNFRRSTAIQIAIHMVNLLSRFKTEPYSGEVCMIVSEERMGPNGWSDKTKYNKVFLGDVKIYKVTDKHDEILNSQNPEFNKHLKNSLEYIRQAGLQINET
jgi:thioesterase domain-containing protein/acyl carrier protein